MNVAVIMRGLPGTGKSTIARLLAGRDGAVHSTNDYFVVGGRYRFDARLQKEYHAENFRAFVESLKRCVPVVVCDNTNIRYWNYQHYMGAARKEGYQVHTICMPHIDPSIAAVRSPHFVPEHHIRLMLKGWED